MCQPAPCETCGKTTWKGCGKHAQDVLDALPADQRCTCDRPIPEVDKGSRDLLRRRF